VGGFYFFFCFEKKMKGRFKSCYIIAILLSPDIMVYFSRKKSSFAALRSLTCGKCSTESENLIKTANNCMHI